MIRHACLICLVALAGCRSDSQTRSEPPQSAPWFEDVTAASGINFVHVRATEVRYWLPEITSGGAAWIDFDNDGDLDVYFVQGGELDSAAPPGPGNVLYENNGDGTFRDATDSAGVGNRQYGMGAAVADYDADGFEDLYVTNVGANVLYRNRGDGTFEDVTQAAGVGNESWGAGAAFVDYDDDGHLDLFVVNYVRWSPDTEIECLDGAKTQDYCAPTAYQAPSTDTLYRNRGDGTFDDVSEVAGLSAASGNGFGIAVADFNLDGKLDFYVANDGNPNQLWIQGESGRFEDQGLMSGCAVNRVGAAEAGMGVAAVDLENDGDPDLFMTHLTNETNTLYQNTKGRFDDATATRGLAAPSKSLTGFGLGFADFNHDGFRDLFIANGRVSRRLTPLSEDDDFAEPNQLFQGHRNGRFAEVARPTDPALIETSRSAVFGDFNGDGSTDILVTNNDGPVRLLANRRGAHGNWIRFRVRERDGRDALNARVKIEADGRTQWRTVQRAYSYLGSNEADVHFGLAAGEQATVEVIWRDGQIKSYGMRSAGKTHELRRE